MPTLAPDYRDTVEVLVHKDLRWHFDANLYCAPARWVGQELIAKADSSSVALYDPQGVEIVRYPHRWRRGQTVGAERFEKELLLERPAAHCSQAQQRLLALLRGLLPPETVEAYLRGLADSDRSLLRQLRELLDLFRAYRPEQVAAALGKGFRRPGLRCRLRNPPLAPDPIPARATAALAAPRSGTQSTLDRPLVPAGLRHLHPESPKGVFYR